MEPLSQVLAEIASAMDRTGIRYAVGGSLASSARGVWRSTLDVDLVAAIPAAKIPALVAALGTDWYADTGMIERAIQIGRPFNLIHTRLAYKVDVFPASEEFHLTQLARSTVIPLGPGKVPCAVTSPEDILLAKLRWYRDGGEVSDRQWNDITGLVSANPTMDAAYLEGWAARLGVTRLLEKARADAQAE